MGRLLLMGICMVFGTACGPVTEPGLQGVDNTLAGNGNLQVSGSFLGTGTLASSVCDAACAPNHDENLRFLGGQGALRVKVGATAYPATYDGNTVAWRAVITGGTCNGTGQQIGSIVLTDTGATGIRINTSTTHCNNSRQFCSCTYAMMYSRTSFTATQ